MDVAPRREEEQAEELLEMPDSGPYVDLDHKAEPKQVDPVDQFAPDKADIPREDLADRSASSTDLALSTDEFDDTSKFIVNDNLRNDPYDPDQLPYKIPNNYTQPKTLREQEAPGVNEYTVSEICTTLRFFGIKPPSEALIRRIPPWMRGRFLDAIPDDDRISLPLPRPKDSEDEDLGLPLIPKQLIDDRERHRKEQEEEQQEKNEKNQQKLQKKQKDRICTEVRIVDPIPPGEGDYVPRNRSGYVAGDVARLGLEEKRPGLKQKVEVIEPKPKPKPPKPHSYGNTLKTRLQKEIERLSLEAGDTINGRPLTDIREIRRRLDAMSLREEEKKEKEKAKVEWEEHQKAKDQSKNKKVIDINSDIEPQIDIPEDVKKKLAEHKHEHDQVATDDVDNQAFLENMKKPMRGSRYQGEREWESGEEEGMAEVARMREDAEGEPLPPGVREVKEGEYLNDEYNKEAREKELGHKCDHNQETLEEAGLDELNDPKAQKAVRETEKKLQNMEMLGTPVKDAMFDPSVDITRPPGDYLKLDSWEEAFVQLDDWVSTHTIHYLASKPFNGPIAMPGDSEGRDWILGIVEMYVLRSLKFIAKDLQISDELQQELKMSLKETILTFFVKEDEENYPAFDEGQWRIMTLCLIWSQHFTRVPKVKPIFDKEDPEAQLALKNALSGFHFSLDELYEMFHIF
eukprot:CAMPEP_0197532898 /NCGR_PEP_ID=MMETSP1318-20131121/41346_1 /TAXON_ID=552666 /ORGANISM="Partenskyella glossopodia, Strain RCC365" /LENGTH=685 /DNA_ID=CAMNT_0043089591 /DNA_START=106 /DNA_END=2164 /DNA_ORIENTATION=+